MTEEGKIIYYVTYHSPGAFFAENSKIEVPNHDMKVILKKSENAYSFTLTKKTVFIKDGVPFSSPEWGAITYFIDAEIFTLAEVKKQFLDSKILISNMEINGYDSIIKTNCGWFLPFYSKYIFIKREDYI